MNERTERGRILSQNLVGLMEQFRLTHEDVADLTRLSPRTIQNLRVGDGYPSKTTIKKIESAFGQAISSRILSKNEISDIRRLYDSDTGKLKTTEISGNYQIFRQSINNSNKIIISSAEIGEDDIGRMTFKENINNRSMIGDVDYYMNSSMISIKLRVSGIPSNYTMLYESGELYGFFATANFEAPNGYFPTLALAYFRETNIAESKFNDGILSANEVGSGILEKLSYIEDRVNFRSIRRDHF